MQLNGITLNHKCSNVRISSNSRRWGETGAKSPLSRICVLSFATLFNLGLFFSYANKCIVDIIYDIERGRTQRCLVRCYHCKMRKESRYFNGASFYIQCCPSDACGLLCESRYGVNHAV